VRDLQARTAVVGCLSASFLLFFAALSLWALTAVLLVHHSYGKEETIFFSTNRLRDASAKCQYSSRRAPRLQFGTAGVRLLRTKAQLLQRPFLIAHCSILSETSFTSLVHLQITPTSDGQPFVFVHGYRTSFVEAVGTMAQLRRDLKLRGPTIAFSWPSADTFSGYVADIYAADWSAAYAEHVLAQLTRLSSGTNVLAHSMGGQVVTKALESGARPQPHQGDLSGVPRLNELVFVAPDVDLDRFSQQLLALQTMAHRITVYVAKTDRALWLSTHLGKSSRLGRADDAARFAAMIDVVDVSAVEPDLLGIHHSYYKENSRVLEDEWAVLQTDLPPGRRFGLERVNTNGLELWQLTPKP
jgi:esterase/lipase superfamily enzyme